MNGDWTLTVSELNEYARRQLAADPILRALRVRGEISGFKRHTSGHLYFSIKDERSRVQCVMFRQDARSLTFDPRDGMRVVVAGAASIYAATGSYQLYCEGMTREGEGELFARFEALKRMLAAEGLFDPARKKPLPTLPKRVGIVTSPTGAAVRDMIRVLRRRAPKTDILLCPVSVQGVSAAREIASALDRLSERGDIDVILCGRGGGSIEDLWAFNEEIVARAIARCAAPVVSCVGHETDFTIADFAADVRAATPSVAAELAVPVVADLRGSLDQASSRLRRSLIRRMALERSRLRRFDPSAQMRRRLALERMRLHRFERFYAKPARAMTGAKRDALMLLGNRLRAAEDQRLLRERNRLSALERALRALNPASVLDRGYAVLRRNGRVVSDAAALDVGACVALRLRDGEVRAAVEAISIGAPDNG